MQVRKTRVWIFAALALAVIALVAYRVSIAGQGDESLKAQIAGVMEMVKGYPYTPVLIVGTFVIGSLLLFPITILIAATVLIFDPKIGVAYALTGVLASAAAGYWLGRYLGRDYLLKKMRSPFERVNSVAKDHAVLAVFIIRHMPIAPFTVVNMLIGASQIPFLAMLIGTMLGIAPGILILYYLKSWV